jgi:hypothetical protein
MRNSPFCLTPLYVPSACEWSTPGAAHPRVRSKPLFWTAAHSRRFFSFMSPQVSRPVPLQPTSSAPSAAPLPGAGATLGTACSYSSRACAPHLAGRDTSMESVLRTGFFGAWLLCLAPAGLVVVFCPRGSWRLAVFLGWYAYHHLDQGRGGDECQPLQLPCAVDGMCKLSV